jgi:NADH-quinone oxidoreductase subunit L
MFRQLFMVFHGPSRVAEPAKSHIHESPRLMTVPLIVLAAGSICAGWLATPEFMWGSVWDHWLGPVLGGHEPHHAVSEEIFLMALTVGLAALGIFLAFLLYGRDSEISRRIEASPLYQVLAGKYYVDELYDRLTVQPFTAFSAWLARRFDPGVIDGAVNGAAASVRARSLSWRRLQSGNVQHYLFAFLAGTLLLFAFFLRW